MLSVTGKPNDIFGNNDKKYPVYLCTYSMYKNLVLIHCYSISIPMTYKYDVYWIVGNNGFQFQSPPGRKAERCQSILSLVCSESITCTYIEA